MKTTDDITGTAQAADAGPRRTGRTGLETLAAV